MTYVDGINAPALDKFLDALESGKYEQGTHRLHTASTDRMCCLGVASAELGPECGVTLTSEDNEFALGREYYDVNKEKNYYLLMPPSVTAYLGIPEDFVGSTLSGDFILVWATQDEINDWELDTDYVHGQAAISVSSLNDRGATFVEIAKRIRETFTKKEN